MHKSFLFNYEEQETFVGCKCTQRPSIQGWRVTRRQGLRLSQLATLSLGRGNVFTLTMSARTSTPPPSAPAPSEADSLHVSAHPLAALALLKGCAHGILPGSPLLTSGCVCESCVLGWESRCRPCPLDVCPSEIPQQFSQWTLRPYFPVLPSPMPAALFLYSLCLFHGNPYLRGWNPLIFYPKVPFLFTSNSLF